MLAYVEYMFTREQSSKANILAKCKNSTFIIAGQAGDGWAAQNFHKENLPVTLEELT